jgi:hypothetical protein
MHLGLGRGNASQRVFVHRQRDVTTSVYGGDFTTTGGKSQPDWSKKSLEERYELNELARLGPGANDDTEAKMLNRIVRWTEADTEYEADPRQPEQLVRDLGMSGSKPVGTPGAKTTTEQLSEDKELAHHRQKPYRGGAARANYLSADRPDLQHAAKEVCRWMSTPTETALVAPRESADTSKAIRDWCTGMAFRTPRRWIATATRTGRAVHAHGGPRLVVA